MKVCTLLLLATHASLASPTPGRALIVDQGGRIRNDKPSASLFGLRKIGGALHRSLAGQLDVIFNRNKKTKRERIQHSLSSISVVLIGWGVGQHACRTASETPKLLGHLKHVNVLPLCAAQIVALYSSPVMRSAHNAIAVRASSHPFRPDRPTHSHSPFLFTPSSHAGGPVRWHRRGHWPQPRGDPRGGRRLRPAPRRPLPARAPRLRSAACVCIRVCVFECGEPVPGLLARLSCIALSLTLSDLCSFV